jgi:predicted enzyme related to lactoylglutathione lyase
VLVRDIEAALAKARALGAVVSAPATLDMGRYASVRDPQGAMIYVFEAGAGMGDHARPGELGFEEGALAWCELMSADVARSRAFYGDLFGWVEQSMPMGGGAGSELYRMFAREGGAPLAGLMAWSDTHWLLYFYTADVAAAAERVTAAGGRVVKGPMLAGDKGEMLICQDPWGAAFAFWRDLAKPQDAQQQEHKEPADGDGRKRTRSEDAADADADAAAAAASPKRSRSHAGAAAAAAAASVPEGSFHGELEAAASVARAFEAASTLAGVRGWWAANASMRGALAKLEFARGSSATFRRRVLRAGRAVEWHCVEADGEDAETWRGTRVLLEVASAGRQRVRVTLTHAGLLPSSPRFEAAAAAWRAALEQHLKAYLESGEPRPLHA